MSANDTAPVEKARQGLALIREAILELLRENPGGLRNTDIAERLRLQSEHQGKQHDYLTYSVLGLLLKEGRIKKMKQGSKVLYAHILPPLD